MFVLSYVVSVHYSTWVSGITLVLIVFDYNYRSDGESITMVMILRLKLDWLKIFGNTCIKILESK